MACAWLVAAMGPGPDLPAQLAGDVDARAWDAVAQMADTGFSAPVTTSMGRLFDAVAALCGAARRGHLRGPGGDRARGGRRPVAVRRLRGPRRPRTAGLDARPAILDVVADLRAGTDVAVIAARFHRAIAAATATACAAAAAAAGTDVVVLSGGVFQNQLLLHDASARLRGLGLRVLVPQALPPNDGGISYGQAAIAAART